MFLAFINFTHIVDSMLIMPLGDLFIETFDLTAGQFGLLVSIYAYAAAVSSLIAFFYLDTFDRKRALLTMFSGFGIGTFLCAFAPSYEILVLLRMLTGFFGGVIGALVLSIVSDLYKFEERGKAMGVLMAAFSAASALGIPAGLYLATLGSWHTPFFIIGLLAMVVAIVVAFVFPSMTDHLALIDKNRSPIHTIKKTLNDHNQLWALLAGFVLVFGHFLIIPFISPYLIKNVGLTQNDISLQFLFGGLATIFTAPAIGYLTDKFGVNKIFVTTMLLCFIPVVLITNMSFTPVWIVLLVTTSFFVFASGRMIPANTIITAAAGVNNRGSFMSIKSALQQFAIGLAGTVSSMIVWINDDRLYEGYNIVGYCSVLFGIVTIFLLRKVHVAEGN